MIAHCRADARAVQAEQRRADEGEDDDIEDDPDQTFYDDPDDEEDTDEDEDDDEEEETWQVLGPRGSAVKAVLTVAISIGVAALPT